MEYDQIKRRRPVSPGECYISVLRSNHEDLRRICQHPFVYPHTQGAGGAIYNQGFIRLHGGALFADNKCGAGDGGAVWNGPTGTLRIGGAQFKSNEAVERGRGGAVWNEGIVKFDDAAIFANNEVGPESRKMVCFVFSSLVFSKAQ